MHGTDTKPSKEIGELKMNSQLKLAAYLAGVSAAALAVDTQAEVIHESNSISVDDDDSSTSETEFISFSIGDFAFGGEDFIGKIPAGKDLEPNSINLFPKDISLSGKTEPFAVGNGKKDGGEGGKIFKNVFLTSADEGDFLDGQAFTSESNGVELTRPTKSSYLGFEWDHFLIDGPMYGWLEYSHVFGELSVLQVAINNGPGGITVGQTSSVPEPTTLALMMAGVAGIAAARKRRGAKASR